MSVFKEIDCTVKLGNLTCLKTLVLDSLSAFVVDDNVLAALSALPNLKHLRMSDILGITAESLFHLRQSSLRILVLHNCRLTDESLLAISGILQLEHLSMDENDRVTSIGFQHLKNLSRLRGLYVNKCNINDESLAAICCIANLEILRISGNSQVTFQGVTNFEHLLHLKFASYDFFGHEYVCLKRGVDWRTLVDRLPNFA